jgi:hypothetical protein
MQKLGILAAALLLLAVSACGTTPVYDSAADVAKASYSHNGPTSLTLITMVNNKTGRGGHSSLLINSDQRTMYDPAGRYFNSTIAEQNDLLYGLTPDNLQRYVSWHARDTHHVVLQTVEVSPDVARQAFQLAKNRGTSWDAMCSTNVTHILRRVSGFEHLKGSAFPAKLMERFAELPGVETEKVFEYDSHKGNNTAVARQ